MDSPSITPPAVTTPEVSQPNQVDRTVLSAKKPVLRSVRLDVRITHDGQPITRDELTELEDVDDDAVHGPTNGSVVMLGELFREVLRRITKEDAIALINGYCEGELVVIEMGNWDSDLPFGSSAVTRALPKEQQVLDFPDEAAS